MDASTDCADRQSLDDESKGQADTNGKADTELARRRRIGWLGERQRLSEAEKDEYNLSIEANFIKKMGEAGHWWYEMLGECYIHGMMDGEAMAYQNNEGIKTTVFEIR